MTKISFTFLLSMIGSLVGSVLFSSKKVEHIFKQEQRDNQQNISISRAISALIRAEGIPTESPLTFQHYREHIKLEEHPLFSERHKVDVIVFGDSSAYYSLVPEIIREVSGKKVALFASPGTYANRRTARLMKVIASKFLKEGGLAIFCFIPNYYEQDPNDPGRNKLIYPLIYGTEQEGEKYLDKNGSDNILNFRFFFRKKHVDGFARMLDRNVKSTLPWFFDLRLPDLDFYYRAILPISSPDLFRQKVLEDQTRYRWENDPTHGLIFLAKPNYFSQHWEGKSKTSLSDKFRINVNALKSVTPKVGFLVPFSTSADYVLSLRANLGASTSFLNIFEPGLNLPADVQVPMEESMHTANEGAFIQSILLGKWIKNFLGGKRGDDLLLKESTIEQIRGNRRILIPEPDAPVRL
ncbi:MAG: hypothetical protein AB7T49_01575 [Oligoflexales bacterium]